MNIIYDLLICLKFKCSKIFNRNTFLNVYNSLTKFEEFCNNSFNKSKTRQNDLFKVISYFF